MSTPPSLRALGAVLLPLLLGACDASAPTTDQSVVAREGGVDRSHAGAAMPAIDILDPEGETVALADVAAGEPLLVNLWASWCAPCVEELPTLVALAERGEVAVLTLSQDMGPQPSVRAFLEDEGLDAVEAWQDPEMAFTDALPVAVMPTTVLYDAQGREVWRYLGDLDWSGEEAAALLEELD
ncbi:TlpA family protein disulfide reductase [Sphingomicrobium astaxanthinifaciens]|uniref:TlpA family protein disulfide reductase n=1 Tax=Sphingomicrobium astaxanthinifaciens TaxID=1227949 RepID=UPI001FCB1285|nr:TlpA disulfide reductase family protein [Sphingomicrobium astaxanthinifaciens]MCJ7421313.1 TlpA family protein disulfide reductase [Sphingomicrobium astaxanthinifaciens]